MIAVEWTLRRVDRDMVVIDAEPVALRISIGEQASLQHLVRRVTDARHDVGGRERRLFDVGEDVFGISVELVISDLDQREIGLWPDLCEVERVERKSLRLGVGPSLAEQRPAREIPGLDAFEKIALMALAIPADQRLGFGVRQVLDPLLVAEVEFDPDALVVGVDKTVSV